MLPVLWLSPGFGEERDSGVSLAEAGLEAELADAMADGAELALEVGGPGLADGAEGHMDRRWVIELRSTDSHARVCSCKHTRRASASLMSRMTLSLRNKVRGSNVA
jgi:hypothetical protein